MSDGRNVVEISASWEKFSEMLLELGKAWKDTATIARLLEHGPGLRLMALEEVDVPETYRHTKWEPRCENERVILHGVDVLRGVWQQVAVYDNGAVEEHDLGPAPRPGLR